MGMGRHDSTASATKTITTTNNNATKHRLTLQFDDGQQGETCFATKSWTPVQYSALLERYCTSTLIRWRDSLYVKRA